MTGKNRWKSIRYWINTCLNKSGVREYNHNHVRNAWKDIDEEKTFACDRPTRISIILTYCKYLNSWNHCYHRYPWDPSTLVTRGESRHSDWRRRLRGEPQEVFSERWYHSLFQYAYICVEERFQTLTVIACRHPKKLKVTRDKWDKTNATLWIFRIYHESFEFFWYFLVSILFFWLKQSDLWSRKLLPYASRLPV